MNTETLFEMMEEACKPLDCGVVPYLRASKDAKGTLCLVLVGEREIREDLVTKHRRYEVPLAVDALKGIPEENLRHILNASRAALEITLKP